MRKIIKVVKSLPTQQLDRLRELLKTKPSKDNSQQIISSILTFSGLDLILSHIPEDGLRILKVVAQSEDGLTFSEIEKREEIDTDHIEVITNSLSEKLLVYVLKNRQKLHNRLDKVFIIPEIGDLLNPLEDDTISNYFQEVRNKIKKKKIDNKNHYESIEDNNSAKKLVDFLYSSGGLATLSDLKNNIQQKSIEKVLTALLENNIIQIYHDLGKSFKTYLLLNVEVYISMTDKEEKEITIKENININNQYMFLLNLFNVYDIISTYGLFLTKQKEFRKIDIQRLTESMYSIYNAEGKEVKQEEIMRLSLYILYQLRVVSINIDTVNITLKHIEEELNDPIMLLNLINNHLQNTDVDNDLFAPPFEIPSLKEIQSIVKIINKDPDNPLSHLRMIRLLKPLSEIKKKDLINIPQISRDAVNRFKISMNFLCILGIAEIRNGIVKLSEIGKLFINRTRKSKTTGKMPGNKDEKTGEIYINPDFTLIIPKQELPSEVLYHILTHAELIKDDVILNARISKESILKAYKRGMNMTGFLSSLKKYSKIDVPQNLEFMINEWSNQTIKVNINEVTLLKSSHPSFIDDITYGDYKDSIIERLTPNYAVIDRKYLEKIVKVAKKSDVIITLFDEGK